MWAWTYKMTSEDRKARTDSRDIGLDWELSRDGRRGKMRWQWLPCLWTGQIYKWWCLPETRKGQVLLWKIIWGMLLLRCLLVYASRDVHVAAGSKGKEGDPNWRQWFDNDHHLGGRWAKDMSELTQESM